jgi:HPt (histidine-containing phosphotransfer) domain-containing protein
MTANAMEADRDRALAAGMREHVSKPIDPAQLYDALDRWLPAGTGREEAVERERPMLTAGELPGELPGVDQAAGLRRVRNRSLYRRLLIQFAGSEGDAVARVRAALTAGDRTAAIRHAHTLKGVSANLGITGVQAAAMALETALKAGGDGDLTAVAAALDSVLAGLRPLLPAATTQSRCDPAALSARAADLHRLHGLLAADDTEAVELAESLAEATGHTGLREVARLAGEFDFAAALARLGAVVPEKPL